MLTPRHHGRVRSTLAEAKTHVRSEADTHYRHFVPNITMGAPILEWVYKNNPDIYMDCHMMVSDPAKVSTTPYLPTEC
jgi:pentose-5-phosphate-3-epimerase